LLDNEVVDLLASYKVPQLLQHFLSLSVQSRKRVQAVETRPHVGLVGERRQGDGDHREETGQRGGLLGDVATVRQQMSLAQSVKVPIEFGRQFLELLFFFDDMDLEMASRYFLFDILGAEEDDRFGNECNFGALLAVEVDLEFPIEQTDRFV
jgi:hypothetical protein